MNLKNILKHILPMLVSVLLMLLLAEGALHVVNYPPSPAVGWRWDESPYRADFNMQDKKTNQLGLRGQDIAYGKNDFVVLLLGDSQTEAGTQPRERIPEAILQEELNRRAGGRPVKVFTIASAGWGQDQELVWLRKYFQEHRADLVLDWITPVNDYWENTFVDRSITREAGRLKPTFTVARDDRLKQVMPHGFDWKFKDLVGLALGKQINGKQYTLEQHYSDRWLAALPAGNVVTSPQGACPANEVDESVLISSYLAGSRAYTIVTDEDVEDGRSHFSPFLAHGSTRDAYAIAITHRLLQEMADVSKEHNAQFYIFHAYRSDLDAAFREIKCVKTKPAGRYFAFDGSDWLRHLKKTSLSDLLITFDVRSDQALNAAPNDWHFNYDGNRHALGKLADILVQKKIVPGTAQ
jgi:hypothetical protein